MTSILKKWFIACALCILIVFVILWFITASMARGLIREYADQESHILYDRNGEVVLIEPNRTGNYVRFTRDIPESFSHILLSSEDKYFDYHIGVNPVSIARSGLRQVTQDGNPASSTLTQQLVKILRQSEFDRSVKNKIIETVYAASLELHLSKDEIYLMYVNSIPFGNNVQGIDTASRLYFNTPPDGLTRAESLQLVASIPEPTNINPFTSENITRAQALSDRLNITDAEFEILSIHDIRERKEVFNKSISNPASFELMPLVSSCTESDHLTIDAALTEQIRLAVQKDLQPLREKNATHAAVVVIKQPENELLAIIGTPDPEIQSSGNQINMAVSPRPIGSTVKPFIYSKAFEMGLRPYTTVEDKEYKYTIGSGFAFYPKNYDFKYRGEVSLHYALANSLNVPSIKVLEYVGTQNFYDLLERDLEFTPIQPLENYELGIALGELEMDLLSLSYYFSLFVHDGSLHELTLCNKNQFTYQTQTSFLQERDVFPAPIVELTNRILTDRQTGAEQFGLKNNLTIPGTQIAAKTGTSREFHDSWTIGYTPDLLVGVWLGNTRNEPMDEVSGATGAGIIWNDVLYMMLNSDYNHHTPFVFDDLKKFRGSGNIEYGLPGDDYNHARSLLATTQSLITTPHNYDAFLRDPEAQIPIRALQPVEWYVNDEYYGNSSEIFFVPKSPGQFRITARARTGEEDEIVILVDEES